MNYPYSKVNRLEESHNYMYTPFQGLALLQAYQSSRMDAMHCYSDTSQKSIESDRILVTVALPALEGSFDAASPIAGRQFRTFLEEGNVKLNIRIKPELDSLVEPANYLNGFTPTESVNTLDLLHALISAQLINIHGDYTKIWLDRLVQRFEVAKKLYQIYLPGFRKGEGSNTTVRIYWLFALALSLYYCATFKIKYLNTLLKICDLLCSLPENELKKQIPEHGLLVVLITELVGIKLLAENKGVTFATD